MGINDMAGRRVPRAEAALHEGLAFPGIEREGVDAGIIEGIDAAGRHGENDGLAAGQHLSVPMRALLFFKIQACDSFLLPARDWNPDNRAEIAVREIVVSIASPIAAKGHIDSSNLMRRSTAQSSLFQYLVHVILEQNIASIR